MAFFPFSSGYSSGWPSWERPSSSFDPYGSRLGPSYYSAPASSPRYSYRQPTTRSAFGERGSGYDYLPRKTTTSPWSNRYFNEQPSRTRSYWDNEYEDSEDSQSDEETARQPHCTCGRCGQAASAWQQPFRQAGRPQQQQQQQQPRRQPQRVARAEAQAADLPVPKVNQKNTTNGSSSPLRPASPASSEASEPVATPSAAAEVRKESPPPAADTPPALSVREQRLAQIKTVEQEVAQIAEEVAALKPERGSKPYLRLEDLLTKALLRLDGIEAGDDNEVRSARRATVHAVQRNIDVLEGTVTSYPDTDSTEEMAGDDSAGDEEQMQSENEGDAEAATEEEAVSDTEAMAEEEEAASDVEAAAEEEESVSDTEAAAEEEEAASDDEDEEEMMSVSYGEPLLTGDAEGGSEGCQSGAEAADKPEDDLH